MKAEKKTVWVGVRMEPKMDRDLKRLAKKISKTKAYLLREGGRLVLEREANLR